MLSLVFELAELIFSYNTPKTKLTETERNFVVYFVHSGKTRPRAVISRFELKAKIHSAAWYTQGAVAVWRSFNSYASRPSGACPPRAGNRLTVTKKRQPLNISLSDNIRWIRWLFAGETHDRIFLGKVIRCASLRYPLGRCTQHTTAWEPSCVEYVLKIKLYFIWRMVSFLYYHYYFPRLLETF